MSSMLYTEKDLLTLREQGMLSTLIVQTMEYRTKLGFFLENSSSLCYNFWLKEQFKVWWEKDAAAGDECSVRIHDLTISYGFTYRTSHERLVICPQTQRCMFSLATAMQHGQVRKKQ